jgi:sarcosine oxidase
VLLVVLCPMLFLQALIRSCQVHNVEHEVLSAEEAIEKFPGLDLLDDHIAIYSPEAGVHDFERS